MKFNPIIAFLEQNQRFLLTAHETPDGDAIGSEVAMYEALRYLDKEVRIINADPITQKYQYLNPDNRIELLEETGVPEDLKEWVLIILDTNDINNIGRVCQDVLPIVRSYFILDHHEEQDNIETGNLIESDASSTCELLYKLFQEMEIPLNRLMADALYTGIVYDTGSFIYPKTSADTFGIARELVAAGVNPNDIYIRIYESNSISSLRLQSRILSTLELYYDQHVAVQTMLKEDLTESGAVYEEADTLINIPLKSEHIRVSIFFKENDAGLLRCSLRSKGNIDVAIIAQSYNGGGHKTAAGFKSLYPLEVIKQKVLDSLEKYFI